MTTDLFFTPTLPRKLPSSFKCDKAGSGSPDSFSKTKSPYASREPKHETFLTTLRKASWDRNRSERSRPPVSTAADRSKKADRCPVEKKECDDTPACDDLLNDIRSRIDRDRAALNDEAQLVADLNQLVALLEESGLKASSDEPMSLSGAEGAEKNISSPADIVLDRLAALKQLIGTIESNGQNPGNETMTGLERLRQLIAQAMASDNSVHNQSDPGDGLNSNQPQDPGQASIGISGTSGAEGTGSEKPVDIHPALSQVPVGGDSVSKDPGLTKSMENSQVPLQSESGEKIAAPKPHSDMQAVAESNGATKDAKDPELVPGEAVVSNRVAGGSRSPAAAGNESRSGGEPPVENSLTGESSSVSKLINDVQIEKDSPLKGDIGPGGEAGGKVVKLESGTNDSGQLTSQNQSFDKTLESASAPKEADAAQRELRTQTMEQIVRRAVIQIKGGQHEARIDLKPEFMGHIRMQVITENQQVTVKILTEFGFVKDMIDNNIQQLKADLQQQGLEVDKVDVSVSRDAQGNKQQQENAEHAKSLRSEDKSSDRGDDREGQPERPDRSPLRAEGLSTVDYFA